MGRVANLPRPRCQARLACIPWFAVATAALLFASPSAADEDPNLVLPPDAMSFFKELLPASSLGRTADLAIEKDHAVYRFRRERATAEVLAFEASSCPAPTGRVCLRLGAIEGEGADGLASEALEELASRARSTSASSPWRSTRSVALRSEALTDQPEGARPLVAWLRYGRWFLVSVLAASLLAVLRSWRAILQREALVPLGLFGLGAATRILAHGSPADIRDVLGMLGVARRAGWASYLDLLFSCIPPTHEAVFWAHRFAGALGVPLLYIALRSRFTRLVATSGAATLAVLPIVARFDASDTPYAPLCTAFLGAIVAFDGFTRTGSRLSLALGMGLLTVAMQLRPEGPWLVVPAALLSAHGLFTQSTQGSTLRSQLRRPSVIAVVAGGLALNAPFAVWAFVGHTSEGSHAPFYMRHFVVFGEIFGSPWLDFKVSPVALSVMVVLGAVLSKRFGARGILWLLATLVALPLAELAVGQLAHVRYHLPSLHLACGLAGIGVAGIVEALPRPLRGSSLAAVALVILAALPRMDVLTRMWTPQLEFEVFRAGLAKLPPHSTIVTLLDMQDAGFVPFSDPGTVDLVDIGRFPATTASFIYYRAASCASIDAVKPEAGPLHELGGCDVFESRYRLTPIAETEIPAITYRGERYRVDPIPVGFFRAEIR